MLRTSQLFDVAHYAEAAGLVPDLDRCVAHYLKHGGAGATDPHRLFDRTAYVRMYPDVAATGMDPFVHFVAYGLAEGRRCSLPSETLEYLCRLSIADVAPLRVSRTATARGWTPNTASAWAAATVAVFASSRGNFFFRHIADRMAQGLRAAGVEALRLDEDSSRPPHVSADIVVAPHEFFHLGAGPTWRDRAELAGHIAVNTEHPGSTWYFLALRYTPRDAVVVDFSPQSARLLRDLGWMRASYLPLGPLRNPAGDRPPANDTDLSQVRGLEAVASTLSSRARSWGERPVDVLFLGTLTPRRGDALARLAPVLASRPCVIHAPTGAGRPLVGGTRDLGENESLLLARNAKVVLNIHREGVPYFEWHRILMLALEQGAVVLSEPCLPHPDIDAGRHFLTATIDEMPDVLERLLSTGEGSRTAERAAALYNDELWPRLDLAMELRALSFLHASRAR